MNCSKLPVHGDKDTLCMDNSERYDEKGEEKAVDNLGPSHSPSPPTHPPTPIVSSTTTRRKSENDISKHGRRKDKEDNSGIKSALFEKIKKPKNKSDRGKSSVYGGLNSAEQVPSNMKEEVNVPSSCRQCSCNAKLKTVGPNSTYFGKITTGNVLNCAIPCRADYFVNDSERNFANMWLSIWSGCCFLSTLFTVLTFLIDTDRYKYPERPIIFLSACYNLVSLGYIIRLVFGHEAVACDGELIKYWIGLGPTDPNIVFSTSTPSVAPAPISPTSYVTTSTTLSTSLSAIARTSKFIITSTTPSLSTQALTTGAAAAVVSPTSSPSLCITVFLFTYYFGMASALWWVVLALTWFLAAALKWGSECIAKYSFYFHLPAWIIPLIQTVVVLLTNGVDGDPVSGMCFTGNLDLANLRAFVLAPLLTYLVVGTVFLFLGFISLFRIRRAIRQQGI